MMSPRRYNLTPKARTTTCVRLAATSVIRRLTCQHPSPIGSRISRWKTTRFRAMYYNLVGLSRAAIGFIPPIFPRPGYSRQLVPASAGEQDQLASLTYGLRYDIFCISARSCLHASCESHK